MKVAVSLGFPIWALRWGLKLPISTQMLSLRQTLAPASLGFQILTVRWERQTLAAAFLGFPISTIRRGLKFLVLRMALLPTPEAWKPIFS